MSNQDHIHEWMRLSRMKPLQITWDDSADISDRFSEIFQEPEKGSRIESLDITTSYVVYAATFTSLNLENLTFLALSKSTGLTADGFDANCFITIPRL